MLRAAHWLLMGWYFVGPVAALVLAAVWAQRTRRPLPLMSWLMTCITAIVLGALLTFIYAYAVGGQMVLTQAALAAYFGAGLLFLLKGLDYLLRWIAENLLGLSRATPTASQRSPAGGGPRDDQPPPGDGNAANEAEPATADGVQPAPAPQGIDPDPGRMLQRLAAFLLRVGMLFALGLPYVMTAVMTYRPKVLPLDPPRRAYEAITFTAADGTRLSGWWIPSDPAPEDAPPQWGRRTLLLCHGLAANKSNHLPLGQWGPAAGYNVLSFDFRAHGESGGQVTTFGDRERLDVLAAVRWLREQRAGESEQIFGIGASMGAAALIAAAADDSPEGQAIDAVVVFGTYARLNTLAARIADQQFVWPLDVLVKYIAVPLANVQTGRRLTDFAPADYIARIWPRPVMILHGLRDEVIPFEEGEDLAREAARPFLFRPVERAGHNDIIENNTLTDEVRHFLDTAEPVPVI